MQAFFILYNVLNKRFAKKNLNELLERFIFAQTSGWSYNFLIKTYWFYQNINYSLNAVKWSNKNCFYFVFIFFESLKDQMGYFVSVTLGLTINMIKRYKIIIKNRSILLNPFETQALLRTYKSLFKNQVFNPDDVFNQLIVNKFHNKSLSIIKNVSMDKKLFINYTQFRGAEFFKQNHIFFTAVNEEYKILHFNRNNPLFHQKFVLGRSYTSGSSLEVQNEKVVGEEVTRYILPDGTKLPDRPTFTFTTVCDHTILNQKAPLRHFYKYGLRTPLDVLQFQLLNNLKLTLELEKIIDSDIIVQQTKRGDEGEFVSLKNLCKNNSLYVGTEQYINDDYPQFLSTIDDILKNFRIQIHEGIKHELNVFHSKHDDLDIYLTNNPLEKSDYDSLSQLDYLLKTSDRLLSVQSKIDFYEHITTSAPLTIINKFNALCDGLDWEEVETQMTFLKNKNNFINY